MVISKKYRIDYIVFSRQRSSVVVAPSKQEAKKQFSRSYNGFACILKVTEI